MGNARERTAVSGGDGRRRKKRGVVVGWPSAPEAGRSGVAQADRLPGRVLDWPPMGPIVASDAVIMLIQGVREEE
ncbi:conserved hypothetical protein [Coccidioides posadasii str. Silveira]|uniref:Uncharacterized protein n=1 Tax=Coccidioides posadasii (strain RMSCC 757 / Silveira) TaxID=443226 RepID=E9DGT9_COCPS|nr:conserved hypothetical protein [Coccidioides posadasii str. Silveira]